MCALGWSSWMIVCVCNRLNEQRIGAAICGGAECADDVYARCGVRKNCGRCQETIEGMLEKNREALALAAE
jgi:bacterioferritin-associated ferredoxin